jgi:hypothetical protein
MLLMTENVMEKSKNYSKTSTFDRKNYLNNEAF